MFNKISNMLGRAVDFGSSLIKPMKNHISNGWEMLKNGASKVGQFVSNNHEAIGSILSGVGNIIGNMPNSPLKQRLQDYGDTAGRLNDGIHGGYNGYQRRPQNIPRQQFSNNLQSMRAQTNQSAKTSTPSVQNPANLKSSNTKAMPTLI